MKCIFLYFFHKRRRVLLYNIHSNFPIIHESTDRCELAYGGECFFLILRNRRDLNFKKAQEECSKLGAISALITSEQSYRAVMDFMRRKIASVKLVWTGMLYDPVVSCTATFAPPANLQSIFCRRRECWSRTFRMSSGLQGPRYVIRIAGRSLSAWAMHFSETDYWEWSTLHQRCFMTRSSAKLEMCDWENVMKSHIMTLYCFFFCFSLTWSVLMCETGYCLSNRAYHKFSSTSDRASSI